MPFGFCMRSDDRVYVAGHTGLVGSAILRALRAQGYARLVTAARRDLDLRDAAAVARFFEQERPACVFLAAARVGGIQENAARPADFIRDNLEIEVHVIDQALRAGTKRLLFLASTCVYPKHADQPMRPEQLMTGPIEPTNEPYAVAKIAGIRLCQAYRKQHGADFFSVVAANAYGPGDHFDESGHVISSLMQRIHKAKTARDGSVTAWGTGSPKREFLHVDDLASACLFLMGRPEVPEIVNAGSGEEISIGELAEKIRRTVGFSGEIRFDPAKPDGMPRRLLDTAPLRTLGWKPRVPLDAGLAETYQAYLDSLHGRLPPCRSRRT